jgi:hypothetical protein
MGAKWIARYSNIHLFEYSEVSKCGIIDVYHWLVAFKFSILGEYDECDDFATESFSSFF